MRCVYQAEISLEMYVYVAYMLKLLACFTQSDSLNVAQIFQLSFFKCWLNLDNLSSRIIIVKMPLF